MIIRRGGLTAPALLNRRNNVRKAVNLTLPPELVEKLTAYAEKTEYGNRSAAATKLLEKALEGEERGEETKV